jgi:hypothetical protein
MSDGLYSTAYRQALFIFNKEKGGGKLKTPKKGTDEYKRVKAIEADIKSGKIPSKVRTKEQREKYRASKKELTEKRKAKKQTREAKKAMKRRGVDEPEEKKIPVPKQALDRIESAKESAKESVQKVSQELDLIGDIIKKRKRTLDMLKLIKK